MNKNEGKRYYIKAYCSSVPTTFKKNEKVKLLNNTGSNHILKSYALTIFEDL